MKRLTIAIDGPAGAGKSTAARMVAQRLGYLYIDTGAMYRAVALQALKNGADCDDAGELAHVAEQAHIEFKPGAVKARLCLDGEDVTHDIRTPEVTALSSHVSTVRGVREAMVRRQRQLGAHGGVVMEGRDIGTVVFPDADVKVFLDASLEERAVRRVTEMRTKGFDVCFSEIRAGIEERDQRDAERIVSPMRPAPDAVQIVTDELSIEEVVQRILDLCAQRGRLAWSTGSGSSSVVWSSRLSDGGA
jgi:cytidylate kinase